nr:14324_t:CDS:2 [Entrophospora candida]
MDVDRYFYGRCTPKEWTEYCWMPQVRTDETPGDWKSRIWARLMYFRKNDLFPGESKNYLEARISKILSDGSSYAPTIGIAICFSCNQLVYTGPRTSNIGNYDHVGMEKHWKFSCSGNEFCNVNYEEYTKIKQKPKSAPYNFEDNYAFHRYGLWMENATRRLKCAREVGRKIRAINIIKEKWIEYMYHPDGLTAKELAEHYKLLQSVREEMRQYSDLIEKLPPSLVHEAWKRLIFRKRDPIPEEEASVVNPLIEAFLRHEVNSMDKETQTLDIIPICNHEEDIKNQVNKEVEILCRQILKYNQDIFGNFMQKLDKEYEERINTNKKLRSEIEEKKLELDEAEKTLASMKADATH